MCSTNPCDAGFRPSDDGSCEEIPIDQVLLDNGSENSNADVAVSLYWETDCDLDVHVIEPSGFEIYYNAMDSGHGFLDNDIIGVLFQMVTPARMDPNEVE